MNDERSTGLAHESYAGLIARAADGSLDPEGRVRLDTHLMTCADCREALEVQRRAREALIAWQPEAVSPGFAGRVVRAATARPSWTDTWDFRRWTWRLAPVAGTLVLAAVLVATRVDASSAADGSAPAPEASEPIAAVAFATDELSDTESVALLLVADPDETVSAAIEEVRR